MRSDFAGAAAATGRRIVADAIWHGGACAWVGAVANPRRGTEYGALGPDLYGGTAGVGLFLAQLAAATGEADARRTALGALRHALGRAAAMPRRDGLHGGTLGIACAAVRAAGLLDSDELRADARSVVAQARLPDGPARSPDVTTGAAGAILALLELAAALGEPQLVEDASRAGAELIRRASVDGHGWSWAIPGRRTPRHLCGVAHGASGIGWALLELHAATGDDRWRAGAEGAFAYERSWLDERTGTWPDLRIGGQRRGAARTAATPTTGSWCYGEAGIALARIRALAVLGPEPYGRDAEIALDATRAHLAGLLPHDFEDLSLCHGAAGPADVLLTAAGTLGEHRRPAAGLAVELGSAALDRHAGGDWPCGTPGATTPGLFLGLAGIGWLFLRLHDPSIASPLAVDTGARQDVGSAHRSGTARE
jgi:lantibiotic biosynthesis protein